MNRTSAPTAFVFGSGGARGAYEVGVARFLFEDLTRDLGPAARIDILCGTSAGALNATALAAYADHPLHGVAFLAHRWTELRLDRMVRIRPFEVMRLAHAMLGCPAGDDRSREARRGILDPRPFRHLLLDARLFEAIGGHLRTGRLGALSVSATEIATGRTAVFLNVGPAAPSTPAAGATAFFASDPLGPAHILASAAIPFLFAPIRIQGRLYCDGSLRQSVPLSPALSLGAERLVVVSTQHAAARVSPTVEQAREAAASSPLYLLGKAVNALTLDRIDEDLERLATINQLLDAGQSAFGAEFLPRLNGELARMSHRPLRPVRAAIVRPSESLGRMAADHVRSGSFRRRTGGVAGRLLAQLVDAEAAEEADLASYLLFDGSFAASLIDLGYADARSQRAELLALLSDSAGATTQAA